MAITFVKIASVTVGAGGTSTISFSSIPSTYTDLAMYYSLRDAGNGINAQLRFNGVSTNTYYTRRLFGNGASATSDSTGTVNTIYIQGINGSTTTSSTFGNGCMYVPNYTSSNYKSVNVDAVSENNATTAYAFLNAGIWNSSSAITSITLYPAVSSFEQYSTATLYGIKNS